MRITIALILIAATLIACREKVTVACPDCAGSGVSIQVSSEKTETPREMKITKREDGKNQSGTLTYSEKGSRSFHTKTCSRCDGSGKIRG